MDFAAGNRGCYNCTSSYSLWRAESCVFCYKKIAHLAPLAYHEGLRSWTTLTQLQVVTTPTRHAIAQPRATRYAANNPGWVITRY